MAEQRAIESVEDVSPDILEAAEGAEEWFIDQPIDWERFWDKFDCPDFYMADMDSPAARKIQRHIRELRRNG